MFPLCSEKSDWREGPKREPNLVGDRYTTVMSVTRPLHLVTVGRSPGGAGRGGFCIGVGRTFSLQYIPLVRQAKRRAQNRRALP